ncbi:MAG: DUF4258 domain-containing protein [Melioribacteraceae bacterium]
MSKEILEFIKDCVHHKRIHWTYHINMRLKDRFIPRDFILSSIGSYEVIESYPQDKYLPSYLIYAMYGSQIFHILFAADQENNTVTIITAYKPDRDKWENDFKTRRRK